MSQAEDLLNSLTETVIDHTHPVPDSDTHFIIDPYSRQIENTNYNKTVLMRGDHNSERFTFELPRYVDGHDMTLCNRVIVHFDNVGDSIENINSDVAYTDDLRLNPDNDETVICSWLIRREATQIVGILSFSLQYLCVEEDEITYEWNTDSYDEIEVRKSKQNGEAAITKYTNVLEQWRSQLFGSADSVIANIAAEGQTQLNNITAEGESRVSAITNEGQTQLNSITTEGKTQLDSITAEGQTQVAAVKELSETEQEAIELKGSETLASIPEDYTEVYNMANEAVRTKADGVVLEAEGNVITLTDASDDYLRGLNLYGNTTQATTTGKNHLNLVEYEIQTSGPNGVTATTVYDDNGGIQYVNLNGTASGSGVVYIKKSTVKAGDYIFTNFPDRTENDTMSIAELWEMHSANAYANDRGLGDTVTFAEDTDVRYVIFADEGRVFNNEHVCPMLRLATESDATYEPYTGGLPSPNPEYPQEIESIENPTIKVYGKNLLNPIGETTTLKEVTLTNNGDGSFTVNGTSTGVVGLPLTDLVKYPIHLYKGKTYTQSIEILSGEKPNWAVVVPAVEDNDGNRTFNFLTDNQTKTMTKDYTLYSYTLYLNADVTANFTFRVQLECNDHATEYEPYKEIQSVSINHTLPGIPVTSGGNHTDENGRQWICDEVDLERGVYIQRTGVRVITGDTSEHWGAYNPADGEKVFHCYLVMNNYAKRWPTTFCDRFRNVASVWERQEYGLFSDYNTSDLLYFSAPNAEVTDIDTWRTWLSNNPTTLVYLLATPVETPLTDEEIEVYKSLRTNYPNTTILNDSGAQMKVKYNADTKLYIHNTVEAGVSDAVEDVLNDTY